MVSYGRYALEGGRTLGDTDHGAEFSALREAYRLARRRNTSDIVTLMISLAFLFWNLLQFFQIAG